MSITINDPTLIAQLQNAKGPVVIELPDGTILGEFNHGVGRLPPGAKLPFTEAELEYRFQQPGVRTLSEIMQELEARQ